MKNFLLLALAALTITSCAKEELNNEIITSTEQSSITDSSITAKGGPTGDNDAGDRGLIHYAYGYDEVNEDTEIVVIEGDRITKFCKQCPQYYYAKQAVFHYLNIQDLRAIGYAAYYQLYDVLDYDNNIRDDEYATERGLVYSDMQEFADKLLEYDQKVYGRQYGDYDLGLYTEQHFEWILAKYNKILLEIVPAGEKYRITSKAGINPNTLAGLAIGLDNQMNGLGFTKLNSPFDSWLAYEYQTGAGVYSKVSFFLSYNDRGVPVISVALIQIKNADGLYDTIIEKASSYKNSEDFLLGLQHALETAIPSSSDGGAGGN